MSRLAAAVARILDTGFDSTQWRRLAPVFVFALALLSVFAEQAAAQPLQFFKNYFVTGDYVAAGVGLRGLGKIDLTAATIAGTTLTNTSYATGTICIPDKLTCPSGSASGASVPAGADIVAAYLYWQTVEKTQSAFAGQSGVFNGYGIKGTSLGNPNAPVSWSAGGCAGSSQGTTTLRTYRADVRPYLNLDARGSVQGNGQYPVSLADTGSNGGGTPLTLGATLVLVYRVISPSVALNAISFYDGTFAPGNSAQQMSQDLAGFYQTSLSSPMAKLTHVVGNGQQNKTEQLLFNDVVISNAPFPGYYNGSWDNPTFVVSPQVPAGDVNPLNTTVNPGATNSGCVSWGAVIFATTVQDTDKDGLLDVWESNQGYTDMKTAQWVPLPGAVNGNNDLFVEVDYLNNLDGGASSYVHSHLPKQAALDKAGDAFLRAGIHVHFDMGNVYQKAMTGGPSISCGANLCDPYIISGGTGGNSIPENATVCTDSTTLCEFPGVPVVGWKGGFLFVKDNATVPSTNIPLGNFQQGKRDSYHYFLAGHALGVPRSFWSAFASNVQSGALNKLFSIVDSGDTATVTIQSPPLVLKPGDPVIAGDPAFADPNLDRITITGALRQTGLNGTYRFSNLTTSTATVNNILITTNTFTITTANVADGTYNFGNEPQLGLAYAGPTARSGQSDLGGADSAEMFGLWPADDVPGCQPDPSIIQSGQSYCDNQVGGVQGQAGTILHEIGHTLTLTHGGTFYDSPATPYVPTYGQNCNPGFLSVMNYLFQIRGFPDQVLDYSGLALTDVGENSLDETFGIGNSPAVLATHPTRWFAPPNALDIKLGNRVPPRHCNGLPFAPGDQPEVRVDGTTISNPIDWNNDLVLPDAVSSPVDVNFNGFIDSSPLRGFNDFSHYDLRQISARSNELRLSGASGLDAFDIGGGLDAFDIGGGLDAEELGGGLDAADIGGGLDAADIGGGLDAFDLGGGLDAADIGGGTEQDFDTANSTVDPPTDLTAAVVNKSVVLTWKKPSFGQIRTFYIFRLTGAFNENTSPSILATATQVGKVSSTSGPPSTTFTDKTKIMNKTTYTYFVTAAIANGTQSTRSRLAHVTVVF